MFHIEQYLKGMVTGSPNFSTRLITSSDKTITRSLLREEIEKLFNGDSDIALLYFSGSWSS